ncbi:MAG: Fructosamine deglycase FrlB [Candidatus Celerinatantimonas neptuna]|nr:MAG: Fructosamine deglycase FrlB [Candidatus Celerinatantimonas neptuna]
MSHIDEIRRTLSSGSYRHCRQLFLVACGGSLVDMYPARFLLETEAVMLRPFLYTANEFVHVPPKSLTERSLVIVCSHGGNTPEVVASACLAKQRQAKVITLTHNTSASVAEYSDCHITYPWGDESRIVDQPMAIILKLVVSVLEQVEGYEHSAAFRRAMANIDSIVDKACRQIRSRCFEFAKQYRQESLYYILSSGASFGHAYGLAICSLMEMQRLDASVVHSGEFFHGPLEITDEHRMFILLKNVGKTRVLDERVERFLERYARKYEVIDAQILGLGVIDTAVVDYFNPLLFYQISCEYRSALAISRHHPLETRRYMGLVDY